MPPREQGQQGEGISARMDQRIGDLARGIRRRRVQGSADARSAGGQPPGAKRQRGDWARGPDGGAAAEAGQSAAGGTRDPSPAPLSRVPSQTALDGAPSREPSPAPGGAAAAAPAAPASAAGAAAAPAGDSRGDASQPASGSKSPPQERERSRKRSRAREDEPTTGPTEPMATLADLGGLQKELEILNEAVCFPLVHPQLFHLLGTSPPAGVLLHGPPGTGKTRIANAIAHAVGVPFFVLSGPEVVSGVSGDSEARLRSLFTEAAAAAPSLILLDEVDVIASRRDEAGKAMEARIVSQLLTCLDGLATLWRRQQRAVVVIGATSRPEVIDPALRRAGRFDREVGIGIPSLGDREAILRVLTRDLRTAGDLDCRELAFLTPGYVGADLHATVKEAATVCMRRIRRAILDAAGAQQSPRDAAAPAMQPRVHIPSELDVDGIAYVTMEDMRAAVERVQPSSMREGFSTIPDVTWEDVGGIENIREEMELWIQRPIRHPELYKRVGLGQPCGVLLFGPPGCGKTLVAKAIAHEASANFISVKGPELLNKYVGESERAVRMVFARGRASAPCVLFFDELDALAPHRGLDRATPGAERLVNQLLTEMDGVEGREQVFVVGATNRVDMIDTAMMRPGRFDKVLYVPLPSPEQRVAVLRALVRKTPLAPCVDLLAISRDARMNNFSGADCKQLVREAAMECVRDAFAQEPEAVDSASMAVTAAHFELALARVSPSVSDEERQRYEAMWRRHRSR